LRPRNDSSVPLLLMSYEIRRERHHRGERVTLQNVLFATL
jgi:hypothetical protein